MSWYQVINQVLRNIMKFFIINIPTYLVYFVFIIQIQQSHAIVATAR